MSYDDYAQTAIWHGVTRFLLKLLKTDFQKNRENFCKRVQKQKTVTSFFKGNMLKF